MLLESRRGQYQPQMQQQSEQNASDVQGDLDALFETTGNSQTSETQSTQRKQRPNSVKRLAAELMQKRRAYQDRLAKAIVTSSIIGKRSEGLIEIPPSLKVTLPKGQMAYGIDPHRLTPEDIEALKSEI